MRSGYRPPSTRWYNQPALVLLLCALVLPLGLYGLWKSRVIPPLVKALLVGSLLYLLYVLAQAVFR